MRRAGVLLAGWLVLAQVLAGQVTVEPVAVGAVEPPPPPAALEQVFGPGEAATDGTRFRTETLGELDYGNFPWVRHDELGWLYVLPAAAGNGGWVHHPALDWLYFPGDGAPWLFRSQSDSWQYTFGGDSPGSLFHDARARLTWSADAVPAAFTIAVHDSLWRAESSLRTAAARLTNPTAYPSRTDPSSKSWNTVPASDWTSGFWPGCLWLMYEYTTDPHWRQLAEEWTNGLAGQQFNRSTHDIGFMMFCSFGEGYRLTGNPDYLPILLNSAASLQTRYSPIVRGYRSWSWGRWASGRNFTIIADNMMNLELMFWAARQPDGLQLWHTSALQHALTTDVDIVRDDGSTYHVVVYDQLTGALLERTTHQGAGAESDWARGQAWTIYGYVMAFAESRDPRMLDAARRTTAFYLSQLPDDGIPPWDFALPDPINAPRDSSAAAIAASALLEFASLVDDTIEAHSYRSAASQMLASLLSSNFQDSHTEAILNHGTAHFPNGSFNTGLIWGDYYFLEALLRYLR